MIHSNIPVFYENQIKIHIKEYIYAKLSKIAGERALSLDSFKAFDNRLTTLDKIDDPSIDKYNKKFNEITELKSNWDGYDGKVIDKDAISFAKEYLGSIILFVKTLNLKHELPFIAPTSEGGIQFEWDVGDKHLEIEFDNKNSFKILKEFKDHMSEYEVSDFKDTLDLVFWVLNKNE